LGEGVTTRRRKPAKPRAKKVKAPKNSALIEFVGGPHDGRRQYFGIPLMDMLRLPAPTMKHPSVTDEYRAGLDWMCEYERGATSVSFTQYHYVRSYNPVNERERK
jgi:hypothetical protein